MEKKFCLAPMEDYTDPAYRLLCSKYGADFTITEMISAERVSRGYEDKGAEILKGSSPSGIQLFGSNEKSLLKAAEKFEKSKFTEININAGCPVPKIIKNGSGAALLKTPEKLGKIVNILSNSIKKKISVKMRLGYSSHKNALKIAKIIEKNGADSIIVHARTAKQGYSGKADWDYIKKIKKELGIKVYGNGDINNWKDAYRMLKETKCNGAYIGRAAIGNPFIFTEIKMKQNIIHHEILAKKGFLEYYSIREKYGITYNSLKTIAISFCRGFEGAKQMRVDIMKTKKDEDILKVFKETP